MGAVATADRVGLRRLTAAEQQVLARRLRDLKLPARIHQRYRIIAAAREAPSVKAAAATVGCHFTVAYDWVHRFNASGFATFERPIRGVGSRSSRPRSCASWWTSPSRARSTGDSRSRCGRSRSSPHTAGRTTSFRPSATSGSAGCCGAPGSVPSASGPGRPRTIPPSTRKKSRPRALRRPAPPGGGRLLR